MHDIVKRNWILIILGNRPPPRYLLPLFENEYSCETVHMKCVSPTGSFPCKSNSFLYERFCTGTRFETEAQDNSAEMAYCKVNRDGQEEMAQPDCHLSF